MKAPRFWYEPPGFLADLLQPLDIFYKVAPAFRRSLAKPQSAHVPLICVGNIVAGGSGKTPTAIAIAKLLLEAGYLPAFVSRGYGGSERGPTLVDPQRHNAQAVGDEALLLARTSSVWVGRDRAATVRNAENFATHLIMDDGLQNPHLKPAISFLVIDAVSELGNGYLIPAGPLREPLHEALKRVDGVIAIGGKLSSDIVTEVHRHKCQLFQAMLQVNNRHQLSPTKRYFAFAGIGRPEKFYTTCRETGLSIVGTKDFSDHYAYKNLDCDELAALANVAGATLITTEKDWVRLPDLFRANVAVVAVSLVFEDLEGIQAALHI